MKKLGVSSNNRGFTARCARVLLAITLVLLPWASTRADANGVAFCLSGSYFSFAAVPQQPGWYIPTELYYYSGSADSSESFARGRAANFGVDSEITLVFFSPTWVPNEKWFGGQPSFMLAFGGGWNSTDADLSVSTLPLGTQTFNRSDSDTGGSDLYPEAQIAWNKKNHNWMTYLTGDIPVGSFDSERMSNIGLGHTAIDIGGAYTYLNAKSGFETSATLGFTYNGMNTSTNYQSGTDSHLDWAVSQFVTKSWQVGGVGYAYYQLTGDSGSGDLFGAYKSRVASVGPELGYEFTAGGLQ